MRVTGDTNAWAELDIVACEAAISCRSRRFCFLMEASTSGLVDSLLIGHLLFLLFFVEE